jgi:lipoyl(octanoyl) transferase
LIVDNYGTHKTPMIHRWLLRNPRFQLHFTPTSASWINLVERWFAQLTERQIRRGVHRSTEELEREGVAVFETGRGGDVTYHGPGQLVGYPILDLRPDRCDVHRSVRDLEETLIRAIATFGVAGVRVPGLSGVWVGPSGEEKVAAIGVRISRWITSHGFALNVSTDLRHFDLIVPCGIADRGVTSLERLLGRQVPMPDVESAVEHAMREVFGAGEGAERR